MHAEDLRAHRERRWKRREELKILRRELGARVLDARLRQRRPVVRDVRLEHAALMVSSHDHLTRRAREIQASLRIRSVADHVAQADRPVDAARTEVGEDALEGDEVSVDVGDDCDASHVEFRAAVVGEAQSRFQIARLQAMQRMKLG